MQTKIFKSGNSMAVRIPKELGFAAGVQNVTIARKGDTLVIKPVRRESLKNVSKAFAEFPAGFMAEGRMTNSQKERDWD